MQAANSLLKLCDRKCNNDGEMVRWLLFFPRAWLGFPAPLSPAQGEPTSSMASSESRSHMSRHVHTGIGTDTDRQTDIFKKEFNNKNLLTSVIFYVD